MSGSVEERLRHALAQQAETTTTSPDGWRPIRARIDRQERKYRPAVRRWGFVVPAATVAVVALLALSLVVGGNDEGVLRVTGGPGRLYLAPTGVESRFRLTGADTDPQFTPQPSIYRAFGRRAPDGLALQASVVITVPSDFALIGAEPVPLPLRVLAQDVAVSKDHFGRRILTWTQGDGRTVGLMTTELSDAELVVLAGSLIPGDAVNDAPALPAGFEPVSNGTLPAVAPPVSFQNWEADDGDTFTVNVTEVPGVTPDDLAWYLPGGRATNLRGTTGIYSDQHDGDLVWIERPGAVVTVHATGISARELISIAEGLRPVDEASWNELVTRARQQAGSSPSRIIESLGTPKVLTPTNSFFVIRPVDGQTLPPCRPDPSAPSADVVAETVGGQERACYRLGPAHLAADDVSTATVIQDRVTGTWQVEFTLSNDGVARFNRLSLAVGPVGQFAILLDGRLVSAPRLTSMSAPERGVVTGLDEQTARHLADRLKP